METLEGPRILRQALQLSDADALVKAAGDGQKIDRKNRKLEIGSTWIATDGQKTFVNTEAKHLMLRHAFEVLDCMRVQFTTDEINETSRNAILRLGAKQEGIVRHERIMPDGRKRNSVRFSIIDNEWPQVRRYLEHKLGYPENLTVSGPNAPMAR
ncbi:GNAT family N-acetyltransferase [Pseudomonas sp. SK3(2021)]|uniref:GNAT family N-acetyltransferase n=1 Tax=Pseudomonas sp. SK3(2021) TaxID=2841064 RepID=UPI00192B6814|nr:GNAT family protein [Pseudomonas sp. SK3(2021)]QQZ43992.1 GNAT family N-acetyltransferase [Pseudomonas sp. SK3(2021)]